MVEESYNKIRTWYDAYVLEFSSEDSEIQINIDLLKEHASRVIENVNELALSINIDESNLFLLQTAALLHDIGRFDQLVKHGTYADNEYSNHIQIGLNVIEEHDVLMGLEEEERLLVIDCVKMHDLSELPKISDEQSLILIDLLRDADRIDVLRIVSDYYTHKKVHPNRHLDMELKDMPAIAKKVSSAIMAEKVVRREDVETVNDLKLSQMSWIFDMKHKRSFKIVSEKSYIKAIFETLPKSDVVIDMYRNMKIFMENQL
ncbi:HD domain-containing protein [Ancylomarina euxinus]|uniref:HD domain-containing protein n=1 Tax=Ancylomarina euxinus TaxID=2283627 RepID=UPI0012E11115|nr:HD domain-containing protein [Ancylomarina euxinus]MCZ4695206.1 HD domain-containing protein [Ancylomarina euxinus]